MQTTLLGFAFAIIVALLAALIGPFLVDWTQFRSVFEAEASRMVGLPVRVSGTIDARILPSPSLTLRGLEIGGPKPEQTIQARLLNVEFALGPLLRGELRAVDAQLAGPELTVAIDAEGKIDLPKLSVGFMPDSLSIERLTVEDGRAHVVNAATGSRTSFENLWFNGDLRSLAGPFKGEGAFVTGGELYGYRISAGRLTDDGKLRVRLSLDPSDRLLTAEAEGVIVAGQDKPRFEGTATFTRPAGLVVAAGESGVKPPWRFTSRLNLDAAGAKLERIDFLYGPEDSGVRLSGTADLRFGRKPSLRAVLSARQLDLDRLIATSEKPIRQPADALKTLLDGYAGALQMPVPTELSVSADSITLGGASIQLFGADLRLGTDAWTLDRVEFRAPGYTQVSLSGRLDLTPSPGFSGPLSIESNEPGALATWLDGRSDPATQIRPFKARGDVVLSQQRIAVERFKAEIDRKQVEGRLLYAAAAPGQPSRLDAELNAPELDIDSLLAFTDAVRAGTALQPPSEIALGLSADRARLAGVEAKSLRARLKRDAKLLLVERLSVEDLGGARIMATGRIDTASAAPRGSVALDVEARDLDGLIALAAKFAPGAAEPLRRAAARVPQAKLQVTLGLDGPEQPAAGAKANVRFAVDGRIGGLRASLHGQAQQDSTKTASKGLIALLGGDTRIEAQLDGDDGSALVALLGLDKAVAVDQRPGFVNVVLNGKLDDTLRVDGRILAGGLDGKVSGTMHVAGDRDPGAELRLDLVNADIRPLAGMSARGTALQLTLRGDIALTRESVKLSDLKGTLAGTELRGALTLGFAARPSIAGQIEADTLDAAALIAAAVGAPPESKAARGAVAGWSAEPYGAGQFADLDGRVALKVMRATLTPSLPARQLQTALVFGGPEIALEDFEAHVAGGRLTGRLALRRSQEGLAVRAHAELAKLDAAALLASDGRPAIGGRLSAKLDLEAGGLSPKALVGSLSGTGSITLEDGFFANLNPKVFDAVIRASDQGLAMGTSRIRDIVSAALDSGHLRIPRIETTVTVNAGQVRPATTLADADGAELAASGTFDLIQQQMDVRLTLSGPQPSDGSSGRPDIFVGLKGPMPTPHRTIDVSALAGWLTIRRIDQQAKKLEALEAVAREQEAARAKAASAPPAPVVPPAEQPAVEPKPPQRPQPVVAKPPDAKPAAKPAKPPAAPAPVAVAPPSPMVPAPAVAPVTAAPSASAALPLAATPPAPPAISVQEHAVPQVAVPEPRPAPAVAAPPATGAHLVVPAPAAPASEQAPPLPAPMEIRRIPRGPDRGLGSAIEMRPNEPLRLPSSQPSVLDSLIGPRR